jgi:hypothetical protein
MLLLLLVVVVVVLLLLLLSTVLVFVALSGARGQQQIVPDLFITIPYQLFQSISRVSIIPCATTTFLVRLLSTVSLHLIFLH